MGVRRMTRVGPIVLTIVALMLAANPAVPQVAASTSVGSAGKVPIGGTSTGTATFTIIEAAANAWSGQTPGTISISIADALGLASLTFTDATGGTATPFVSAPGSLDASVSASGNTVTVSIKSSDTNNIESFTVSGLYITAAYEAVLGPIRASMSGIAGSASLASPGTVVLSGDPVEMTVTKSGSGTGRVTSTPAGIDCGDMCTAKFTYGRQYLLIAVPDAGSGFTSWTGACAGQTATCLLSITSASSTDAVFEKLASPSPTPSPSASPTPASGPTVSVPQVRFLVPGTVSGTSVPVRVSWNGTAAGSPITAYGLQARKDGGAWFDVALSPPYATSITRSLTVGTTTQFQARAADAAGQTGSYSPSEPVKLLAFQESAGTITYRGSWTARTSASAWGGRTKSATAAGASATFRFTGRAVAVIAPKGRTLGSAKIYLDGDLVRTVSLYATAAKPRQLVYAVGWGSSATHTISIKVVGTRGHPRIDLDGFAILR